MQAFEANVNGILANTGQIQPVHRAIAELRQGGLVLLTGKRAEAALIAAAETISDLSLNRLRRLVDRDLRLLLSGPRASALGLSNPSATLERSEPVAVDLAKASAADVLALANPLHDCSLAEPATMATGSPKELGLAAMALAKLAQLLPAVVIALLRARHRYVEAWQVDDKPPSVDAASIEDYQSAAAGSLRAVTEARVPILSAGTARIIAFRPADGRFEHLAIVIGHPQSDRAVLTRVHSQCFTGDLLGSLRCDCGEQLRGAIQAIADAGSGVLLYLAQEGRGIGLANKLRAYSLQDRGLDTATANELLGFDADEREYLPAVEMLRRLSIGRVRLLTNNPAKVAALARHGIVVEERVPLTVPANAHNQAYLAAKVARLGHLI